jgi:GTP-binding protein
MPDRGEAETRADVARRIDHPDGPVSYEIGSDDDPDRVTSTPEGDRDA